MISNKEIYERAVKLFDDPFILKAYVKDPIAFQKIMYPYLINGVSIIARPPEVCDSLALQEEPVGTTEVFEGAGGSVYELSTTPAPNTAFSWLISSSIEGVRDEGARYMKKTNSVEFSRPVKTGETCSVEWYSAGGFTGIKSSWSPSVVQRVKDLLARVVMIAWADKERNFLLDLKPLMNDTDFKRHSASAALRVKIEWVKSLREEVFNLQNKLDWDMINQNRSLYGIYRK